ncbi:MAG: Ig-like domain-containing protein [Paraprevotella sp.]|nr:Ig-like domain-containing protein [Paraprevotella sp.]
MLQNDITVKTAGKTTATLNFPQSTYSVNMGETLQVTATTNSTASVTYTSSDENIATVNPTTGEISAGNNVGSVTITATVAENDAYTAAEASYTLNVVDPSSLPTAVAFVAEKDGNYYAMTTSKGSMTNSLAGLQVYKWNDKIINTGEADIAWYVDDAQGTITTSDGKYLTGSSSKTDLNISSNICKWSWDNTNSAWKIMGKSSNRSFIGYIATNDSYFKNYAESNIGVEPYADTYTTAMNMIDGYVRSELTAGDYGTICLPYAVAVADRDGAEFFSIAGKVTEGDQVKYLILDPVTDLEAGKPYIFSATSDKLLAVYQGKAVSEASSYNGLTGSFEEQDVANGMYLISQNKVQLCGDGCKIDPNRAYINMTEVPEFTGSANANQLKLILDGASGIDAVVSDNNALVNVYTVSGIEVRHQVRASEAAQGLPTGLYIVNGKKVIIK